ncbi:hypothetical protein P3X46_024014 [Hevea brasiliensis]|uniref:Uncharacterized protein n=1 Tax=Hevea brasiliensis TaxID=3981 RepID=A0ABQ9LCR0_HEVBR|nr:hypothetical protein P3X46_024014 [Hevea brasiliensis]
MEERSCGNDLGTGAHDYVEEAPEGSSGFEAVSSESEGNLDDFDLDGDYCDGVFDRETFGIEEVDNKEHVQDFCGGQLTRKRIRAYEDHEVEKILANSMWGKTGMPSEEIN